MKAPDRIVKWIAGRMLRMEREWRPDFIIGKPGDDYMRRWFVIPRNRFFNVYLHRFIRSDDDRALHDHPWMNCSLLLQGEYTEHTIPQGGIHQRKRYVAGDLKFRGPRSAHRVELTAGPSLSLFITGPRVRDWGFHCPAGWRRWQDFTAPHNSGEIGPGCD
jgi:hypothetical protein